MKKSTPILVTGLIILGIVAAFLGYELNTSTKQNEIYSKEISDLNALMEGNGMSDLMENNITTSLNNLLEEYNSVTTNNQELNDSIEIQKQKVTILLDELKSSEKRRRYTARELNKMQKEAETLRKVMKNYVYKVDSLNTLTKIQAKEILKKDNKISEVSGERDKFKEESENLSKTVELGSKLQILNLKAEAIRVRNSGSFTETSRARRADQVRACFTIVDNKIAKAGPKTFYMRVINPEGKVMMTSKSSKTEVGDESLEMSISRTVDYQNNSVDLCIFHEKGEETFSKGDYKIEIYTDGEKVGSTSFGLK
ncbi:MAG: hypothetical protein ACPGVD_08380 [Flavobacteriales bacterium]